jgi:hypothetical protein
MALLVVYVLLTLVGSTGIYFVGLAIEGVWPVASLPAFLLMFFLMLWLAWLLAVKWTAPKGEAAG